MAAVSASRSEREREREELQRVLSHSVRPLEHDAPSSLRQDTQDEVGEYELQVDLVAARNIPDHRYHFLRLISPRVGAGSQVCYSRTVSGYL